MKKKALFLIIVCLIAAIPAYAVLSERNIEQTLEILRSELHQENQKMERSRQRVGSRNDFQHREMVSMIKKCNELSLMLYSQNQDYTFDMTYALDEVTDQYNKFKKNRVPYDDIVARLELEIDRYQRLIESLRRIPPILQEISAVPDSISLPMDSLMMLNGRPRMHRDSLQRDSLRRISGPEFERDSLHQRPMMMHPNEADSLQQAFLDSVRDRRPFLLDEKSQEDRDSCLYYAMNLLDMYTGMRDRIIQDNEHYDLLSTRLEESYNYAKTRYELIQKRIFIEGQDNFFTVLKSFRRYSRRAIQDAEQKYGIGRHSDDGLWLSKSEWRGPVVTWFIVLVIFLLGLATFLSNVAVKILRKRVKVMQSDNFKKRSPYITLLSGVVLFAITVMIAKWSTSQNFFAVASNLLLVYAWLLAAILLSLLVRLPAKQIKNGVKLYVPVMVLGLIVITFRIIFIPNRLVNLIYPPLLLVFAVWQYRICRKCQKEKVNRNDMLYGWISLLAIVISLIAAWAGYVLLAVQIFIWWLFQLTAIETITAFYDLLDVYEDNVIKKRKENYKADHAVYEKEKKESYIEITWLYDLVKMTAVPVLTMLSIPFCIWMAADVFDLTEICKTAFYKPFFNLSDANGNEILHLSLYKLVLVISLFFIFRYANYAIKAFYRKIKYDKLLSKNGKNFIHANEVNLTLANNVISILVWGIYIITAIILLKIPMGAISIVAAGLATGIGLALKDVLNNFINGIQLMSGRLRVGDYIECDGVRGRVTQIGYQSTQIVTLEDTIMAFTNTTLFDKNFKNLTRNNSYEFIKIPVGVSYGSNVENVREILLEAMEELRTKDKYGRNIVDPKRGISVAFGAMSDSSVDLVIKLYVLVEEEPAFIAHCKELIYKTLNDNNIEIPFPQRDIHIR